MRRLRVRPPIRWLLIGAGLIALVAWAVGIQIAADSSLQKAYARYQAIKPGMRPAEVHRLLWDAGDVMYTTLGPSDIFHVDGGRFFIAVVYEPDPRSPSSSTGPVRRAGEDWVAKEKLFLELVRRDSLHQLLVGLGLKRSHVWDRQISNK